MCADCEIHDHVLDSLRSENVMDTDSDNTEESFVNVNIRNPITHNINRESYTTYDIYIETNNKSFTMTRSQVRRRFSEFYQLRQLLTEQLPSRTPLSLPFRTFLVKRFDSKFIEDRRRGLETFLKEILSEDLYLSCKSVHLFIQSSLGMDEIREVVTESPVSYIAESKPPIVLAMHDETAEKAYSPTSESHGSMDGTVKPPKRILRKSMSATNLRSFKCPMAHAHCHIRIGSRICICEPTLHMPIRDDQDVVVSCPTSSPGQCPVSKAVGIKESASDPNLGNIMNKKKQVSFMSGINHT